MEEFEKYHDYWSLGVTLLECVLGYNKFNHKAPQNEGNTASSQYQWSLMLSYQIINKSEDWVLKINRKGKYLFLYHIIIFYTHFNIKVLKNS